MGGRQHCLYRKCPANSRPLYTYRCFYTNSATAHYSAPTTITHQYLPSQRMLRTGLIVNPTPPPSPDGYSGCPPCLSEAHQAATCLLAHNPVPLGEAFQRLGFPRWRVCSGSESCCQEFINMGLFCPVAFFKLFFIGVKYIYNICHLDCF